MNALQSQVFAAIDSDQFASREFARLCDELDLNEGSVRRDPELLDRALAAIQVDADHLAKVFVSRGLGKYFREVRKSVLFQQDFLRKW